MPITTYLANEIIDHINGKGAYTMPNPVYVGLFTVAPTITGGGTEVSGGSYARQAATTALGIASARQALSTADINYPIATASWGTIVAAAIFDALTGGNMLSYGLLNTPRPVAINDRVRFVAGQITVVAAS